MRTTHVVVVVGGIELLLDVVVVLSWFSGSASEGAMLTRG